MKKFKAYFWKHVHKDYKFIDGFVCKNRDYVVVYIFDNKKEMWEGTPKVLSKDFSEGYEEGFNGKCFTYNRIRENTVTGNISEHDSCLGYIFLNIEAYTASTISHECTHAVINYFNRRIKNFNDIFVNDIYNSTDKESPVLQETFCYMVGGLVRQINNYYWDKIDKKE